MCRKPLQSMVMLIMAIPVNPVHHCKEPWSEIEDEYLKNLYRKGMNYVQRALPNRTTEAIKQRAKRLGITQTTWLPAEDLILTTYYDQNGPRFCQWYLRNRSINAIIKRANKLRKDRLQRVQRLAFNCKWAAGK